MKYPSEVLHTIARYKERFPEETESIHDFENFVKSIANTPDLYSRKNFAGHITASGAILNHHGDKILLLKHKFLGIWLLPGGHVDPEDNIIIDAAYREIKEETGISKDKLSILSFSDTPEPIELDSHPIPPNDKKQEPTHFHHDFRYAFIYNGNEEDIVIDPSESDGMLWVYISKLADNERYAKMLPKLEKLISLNEEQIV